MLSIFLRRGYSVVCICSRSKGIIRTEFSFLPGVLTGLIIQVRLLCCCYLSTNAYYCQYAMHIIANIHCILLSICNIHCLVLSICIVYYCQYALYIIVNIHCILLSICIVYYCQYALHIIVHMNCILLSNSKN